MGCSKFGEECYEFMCGFSENGICTNGENEYFGSIESFLPKTNCDIPMPNVKSPKTELISAAEAYKKAQEVLKEDDIKSLKEINSKILEATKKRKAFYYLSRKNKPWGEKKNRKFGIQNNNRF